MSAPQSDGIYEKLTIRFIFKYVLSFIGRDSGPPACTIAPVSLAAGNVSIYKDV